MLLTSPVVNGCRMLLASGKCIVYRVYLEYLLNNSKETTHKSRFRSISRWRYPLSLNYYKQIMSSLAQHDIHLVYMKDWKTAIHPESGSDFISASFCSCLADFQAFLYKLFTMHWDIEKKSLGSLMANQIYFLNLNKCGTEMKAVSVLVFFIREFSFKFWHYSQTWIIRPHSSPHSHKSTKNGRKWRNLCGFCTDFGDGQTDVRTDGRTNISHPYSGRTWEYLCLFFARHKYSGVPKSQSK